MIVIDDRSLNFDIRTGDKGTNAYYTPLSGEIVKKLEAYGPVELTLRFGGFQYHIHTPKRIVSIIKHSTSYGEAEDLWECAVCGDGEVKNVMGFMTEENAYLYARDWLEYD